MQMRWTDWTLLVVLSLIWGGSFYYAEIALREVSAFVVVWGRVLGAALLLWLILWGRRIAVPKSLSLWAAFFVMGVLNNAIPFSLIVWGQTEITGSLASIFNATTPLFTIVLAQFFTSDEKITSRKVIGLVCGFVGVIVMVGAEALSGISNAILAQLAILLAAVSYGCAAIWGRRFKGMNPMVSATGQVTCSALVMTPVAVIFGFPTGYFMPSFDIWVALLMLAFFCTVVAYILYFRILATSGATNLMLVTFLVPISAIALGHSLLGERLSVDQLIGMGLILFGLLIIDGRLFRRALRA